MLVFWLQNRYQADVNEVSNQIIYKGQVLLNSTSGAPASGAKVLIKTTIDICKTKEYSTTADINGNFSIAIAKPACPCRYRIIAGGNGEYNAVDNGEITLSNNDELMAGLEVSDIKLKTSTTTQVMHSSHPNVAGVYPDGYLGSYHLSQWDTHFLRNKTTTDQYFNMTAPSNASFSLSIDRFTPHMPLEPGVQGEIINVLLSVFAVADPSWSQLYYNPTMTDALDSKEISLNTTTGELSGDELDFNVDFSSLTPIQRYGVWLNGFMISFQFNPAGAGNHLPVWQDLNPDIILPLEAPVIRYSGFEGFTNAAENPCSVSWPTDSHRVTSPFGWRIHPVKGDRRFHNGIDIADGTGWEYDGAKVYAAGNGIVTAAGNAGAYGLQMTVKHCNNIVTSYSHLLPGSILVNVGDYVMEGQHIAGIDNTGWSTGPHLHFSVFKDGNAIDPLSFLPK